MPHVYKADLISTSFERIGSALFQDTSGAHDWIGRPQLLKRSDGVWMVVYRSGITHASAGEGLLHIRFSENEGLTWSDQDDYTDGGVVGGFPIAAHAPGEDVGEGTLVECTNGDILCIVFEQQPAGRNGCWIWRSENGGEDWTDEGMVNSDEELLPGGQTILVGSTLYMIAWADPGANITSPYKTVLYKSVDHGVTWTLVSEVVGTSTGGNECALVQLPNGDFLSMIRADSQVHTFMRRSQDLGVTWGPLQIVTPIFGIVHRPRLRYFGDRLYLTGRDRLLDGAEEYSSFWWSDTNGASWKGPFHWEDSPGWGDGAYCDVLQRGDGTLYGLTYGGVDEFAAAMWEFMFRVLR